MSLWQLNADCEVEQEDLSCTNKPLPIIFKTNKANRGLFRIRCNNKTSELKNAWLIFVAPYLFQSSGNFQKSVVWQSKWPVLLWLFDQIFNHLHLSCMFTGSIRRPATSYFEISLNLPKMDEDCILQQKAFPDVWKKFSHSREHSRAFVSGSSCFLKPHTQMMLLQ